MFCVTGNLFQVGFFTKINRQKKIVHGSVRNMCGHIKHLYLGGAELLSCFRVFFVNLFGFGVGNQTEGSRLNFFWHPESRLQNLKRWEDDVLSHEAQHTVAVECIATRELGRLRDSVGDRSQIIHFDIRIPPLGSLASDQASS